MNCVESLSASARALGHWRAQQNARQSCLGKGFRPGTFELSECELSSTRVPAARAADFAALRIDTATLEAPEKSYYKASSREVRQREQTACARLGYDPVGAAFDGCVADLDFALWDAKHPLP